MLVFLDFPDFDFAVVAAGRDEVAFVVESADDLGLEREKVRIWLLFLGSLHQL